MTIPAEYKRVFILLLAAAIAATWIFINYQSETGAVYLVMIAVSYGAYRYAKDVFGG
jgi:hypothetical protein